MTDINYTVGYMDGRKYLWFLVETVFKNERPFWVRRPAGSHIYPKNGSFKEMARDRHIVTTQY